MANPILIVGAGPVGLTMASTLAHYGLDFRIIDKAPTPSDKSKALVVWCRTLELLAGLGLAETFVQNGMKISAGSMYANGQRLVHLGMTSDESPYGFPLMIPQNITERLLAVHLEQKGITVERLSELVTFVDTGDGVHCTLRHADGREEMFDASWVIGCDGAHSAVRHTLGLEFTGHAEPNDWILADVHIDGNLAKDEVSVFWHDEGVVVFFPIDQSRFRMIAEIGSASNHTLPSEPTLADAQAKVDERGPGGLTLHDPVWLAYFRINERKVSDYRKGRAFLAGDAAHIHSPAGGQGMNTGMQDTYNLAWKLAFVQGGQGHAESLLQSYSHERSAVGDMVLKNAERFTTMATLRSPIAKWLRNHFLPILGSLDVVQDKIRGDWFELSINYRHSPLSAGVWPLLTGGLAAGDRLCDAPLTSAADGHRSSLFSILRGNGHVLLLLPGLQNPEAHSNLQIIATDADKVFPGVLTAHVIANSESFKEGPIASYVPAWFDIEGRLYRKLHASHPTLIVVRPDGYIGFRCQPADARELMKYLDSYLIRKS